MKGSNIIFAALLGLSTFASFAESDAVVTSMSDKRWLCTTNASSADTEKDKAADAEMADKNKYKGAAEAFKFAADNCRDCTEITCTYYK